MCHRFSGRTRTRPKGCTQPRTTPQSKCQKWLCQDTPGSGPNHRPLISGRHRTQGYCCHKYLSVASPRPYPINAGLRRPVTAPSAPALGGPYLRRWGRGEGGQPWIEEGGSGAVTPFPLSFPWHLGGGGLASSSEPHFAGRQRLCGGYSWLASSSAFCPAILPPSPPMVPAADS